MGLPWMNDPEVDTYYSYIENCIKKRPRRWTYAKIRHAIYYILSVLREKGIDPHILDWCSTFQSMMDYSSVHAYLKDHPEIGKKLETLDQGFQEAYADAIKIIEMAGKIAIDKEEYIKYSTPDYIKKLEEELANVEKKIKDMEDKVKAIESLIAEKGREIILTADKTHVKVPVVTVKGEIKFKEPTLIKNLMTYEEFVENVFIRVSQITGLSRKFLNRLIEGLNIREIYESAYEGDMVNIVSDMISYITAFLSEYGIILTYAGLTAIPVAVREPRPVLWWIKGKRVEAPPTLGYALSQMRRTEEAYRINKYTTGIDLVPLVPGKAHIIVDAHGDVRPEQLKCIVYRSVENILVGCNTRVLAYLQDDETKRYIYMVYDSVKTLIDNIESGIYQV
ncbi:MAG: hypothetical protein QXO80_06000 [Thermosphaera sp.]